MILGLGLLAQISFAGCTLYEGLNMVSGKAGGAAQWPTAESVEACEDLCMATESCDKFTWHTLTASSTWRNRCVMWSNEEARSEGRETTDSWPNGSTHITGVCPPPGLRCGTSACATYYNDIIGTKVVNLKSAAKFPDSPDEHIALDKLEIPEGKGSNYGVLLEAWVRPPLTGDYIFSTYSDDSSEVWLSTTPGVVQTEAEMTKVVELDGCCRKVTGTTNVSLEGGKSYYLLGYMKEGSGNDYFQVGFTVNGLEYFPIQESEYETENTLGYVDPSVPAPVCENTGSQYTEALLAKMDTAQHKFGECADDIAGIASNLGTLNNASTVIKYITEAMSDIVDKIDGVFDSMNTAKVSDILGKIPKIGMFIKMGIKAMNNVMDGLNPLFDLIEKWAERIDTAFDWTSTYFTAMRIVATPTSFYLTSSHGVLNAAHNCAQATGGYECGSPGARLEAKNKERYPTASVQLENIANTGEDCHAVLSPMEAVMRKIAEIAEKLEKLLDPIKEILAAVAEWAEEMEEQIRKFVEALSQSAAVQCALEIFEPGTDALNLITCPIDELAGAFMYYVVNNLILKAQAALATAANQGITAAVDALVPDNFAITIPDFTTILPHDAWFGFCELAAQYFPDLPDTIEEFLDLELPYTATGKDIENEILERSLIQTDLTADLGGYESACKEAWKEFGGDFDNCKKVLDEIAKAAKLAACETAKLALKANEEAVDAALSVAVSARRHFEDAQSDFNSAQSHLSKVQGDLNSAINKLNKAKDNCPNCSCSSCKWYQASCIAESAWCCPVKKTCEAALTVAAASVTLAKSSVTVAQQSVNAASVTYNAASSAMSKAEADLSHFEGLAAQAAADVDRDCERRRAEVLELPAPLAKRLGGDA